MRVLLRLLGELIDGHPRRPRPDRLDAELLRWSARRADAADISPFVLSLGVLTWTRLHGIVSLELAGVFASVGIDAGAALDRELKEVIDETTA